MNEVLNDKTYEEAFMEIEELISRLEKGELSLDDTLKYFEQAVRLVTYCKNILDGAEQKLAVLLETEEGDLKLENLF